MKFNNRPVVATGPGWIEAEQADGTIEHLTGYNETLIEVEAGETHPVTALANETTIRDRAVTALADNQAFLTLASPTNAQTLTQVKALTRQTNGLIRLVLRRLDGTD